MNVSCFELVRAIQAGPVTSGSGNMLFRIDILRNVVQADDYRVQVWHSDVFELTYLSSRERHAERLTHETVMVENLFDKWASLRFHSESDALSYVLSKLFADV
jgi:hypothetical protein